MQKNSSRGFLFYWIQLLSKHPGIWLKIAVSRQLTGKTFLQPRLFLYLCREKQSAKSNHLN